MRIIVIGGGEVGKAFANMLSSEKHIVSLIESDEAHAKELSNSTDALIIHGDATQMQILKDAGIEKADAVAAVTNDDKTNLMVCEIAKSLEITKVVARVNNPENEELFTKLKVTDLVPVVGITVTRLRQLLSSTGERVIATLGSGNIQVFEITLDEDSKLIGKPAIIKDAVIGTIYRNGDLIIPESSTTLEKGDVLIVLAKSGHVDKLRKLIAGS
ncbi:MAG: NAD-binding protein [archaeon]